MYIPCNHVMFAKRNTLVGMSFIKRNMRVTYKRKVKLYLVTLSNAKFWNRESAVCSTKLISLVISFLKL